MGILGIFKQFPILFILLGAFLGINQYFQFVPKSVLQGKQGIIVPIVFIIIGVGIIIAKKTGKLK